ncbi:hypothetical protein AB0M05_35340 [Streptomyces violaceusniger]|uniref:hypothetical protein n=1 Tax=Streptomyces violaceusniger TaxID=68280 RepID=UPI0034320F41
MPTTVAGPGYRGASPEGIHPHGWLPPELLKPGVQSRHTTIMKKNVGSDHEGGVVRLTINTETDTYEQAIAAVQAAYGLRPVTPADWPEPPAVDPRPGPRTWTTMTSGTAGASRRSSG